jgi:glutathione S-transferase
MLTIWGGLKSNNVQKVVWTADELGLDHMHIPAGMEHGGTDAPEFRAMNPNGLVPVIDDGGFILWESNAIVRYLGSRYGNGHFYPADLRERAHADRWMDWAVQQFYPAMGVAFRQLVRTGPARRDQMLIDDSLARAERFAAILDAHLEGKAYANGDHFSMADICLGVVSHRWLGLPGKREKRPSLERWFESVRGRKAARKVLVLPLR